jgi:calcineurin-like phosphoesterase family protein
MTIWFTADTHFGHANIIQNCKRPFSSVMKMNEKLIENWNRVYWADEIMLAINAPIADE